jgi:hypothetical protein
LGGQGASPNYLLANAALSKTGLGTINGVVVSTACLARAIGPTVTGHSASLKLGYNGIAWWACGLVCAIGALELWMEESEGIWAVTSGEEQQNSHRSLLDTVALEDYNLRGASLASMGETGSDETDKA